MAKSSGNPFGAVANNRTRFPSKEDKEALKDQVVQVASATPGYRHEPAATPVETRSDRGEVVTDQPDVASPTDPISTNQVEIEGESLSDASESALTQVMVDRVGQEDGELQPKPNRGRRKKVVQPVNPEIDKLKSQYTNCRISMYTNRGLKGLGELLGKTQGELIQEFVESHPMYGKVKDFYSL